jgi:hypothetical protein
MKSQIPYLTRDLAYIINKATGGVREMLGDFHFVLVVLSTRTEYLEDPATDSPIQSTAIFTWTIFCLTCRIISTLYLR